jgi:hypothetical protein
LRRFWPILSSAARAACTSSIALRQNAQQLTEDILDDDDMSLDDDAKGAFREAVMTMRASGSPPDEDVAVVDEPNAWDTLTCAPGGAASARGVHDLESELAAIQQQLASSLAREDALKNEVAELRGASAT